MYFPKITSKNSALLVVDVVNSCASEKNETKQYGITFSKIRNMIPKLEKFIQKFRRFGAPVIFLNITPWTKEFLPKNIIELYNDPHCKYFSMDKSGYSEQFYLVKPQKDDEIFTKNTMDAFTNEKLVNFLIKSKIQYLIVVGIFGDGCVQATINGGFSKGFNFIILKDLIETTDVPIRQRLQKLLKQYTWPIMYGPTMTQKEFLDHYAQ